jgi:6,7-dimethyl-8-ribityllumazine synthase
MAEPQRSHVPTYSAPGARILIVEARYYDGIGDMLLAGARRAIEAAGATSEVIGVPGALEIPAAINVAMRSGLYAGAIALGCVIRGETYHFEIVAGESSRAIMDLTVQHDLAIGNGILTVENEEQAIVRADPAQGDKGGDAARAALALLQLMQRFGVR